MIFIGCLVRSSGKDHDFHATANSSIDHHQPDGPRVRVKLGLLLPNKSCITFREVGGKSRFIGDTVKIRW